MTSEIDRIIPVYKPVGFSTFDLIRIFKKKTGYKGKIGHGGTLDPFACGVVLLLLGKATKKFEEIKLWDKVYIAGLRLGIDSETGDIAGEVRKFEPQNIFIPDRESIEKAIKNFIGEIDQKVPLYSAAKYKGRPLYKLAKNGIKVEKSKMVKIYNIELINYRYPILTIRVCCSGGVYIRQLAHDIAEELGTTCLLFYLERERVGNFTIKECYLIEDFEKITIQ
jgi:tRNA pseudouridine55 synthase